MTMLAWALAGFAGGCTETARPALDAPRPQAELRDANPRARTVVLGLSSAAFSARPPAQQASQARELILAAWGETCEPTEVRDVIGVDPERSSWRVTCRGGRLSSTRDAPDYLLEIPNQENTETLVSQCHERADGSLRCDATGRDRS